MTCGGLRNHAAMSQRLALHSPLRMVIGVLLMALAVIMLLASDDLDWGIAATTVIPALCLSLIALTLLKRKVLLLEQNRLQIETGWLWRRCHQWQLEDCRLELAPMAGLWAVVLHQSQRSWPLAAWISRRRAEDVLCFLDQVAPQGRWPRQQFERAQWDR